MQPNAPGFMVSTILAAAGLVLGGCAKLPDDGANAQTRHFDNSNYKP